MLQLIKNLTVTHKQNFDALYVNASYTLVLPTAHAANGTSRTIEQDCTCQIAFYPGGNPYLVFHGRLVSIVKPERFGTSWNTTEERLRYVHGYIADAGSGIAI